MSQYRILVPLDGSPLSAQTIDKLIALKNSFTDPLTLLHVIDFDRLASRGFPEVTFAQFKQRAREEARKFITGREEEFAAAGVKVESMLREGEVQEAICALADSGEYDLLVIGRHADSEMRALLFGQVPNYLIHHVKCPVLIV